MPKTAVPDPEWTPPAPPIIALNPTRKVAAELLLKEMRLLRKESKAADTLEARCRLAGAMTDCAREIRALTMDKDSSC
jgi:hypothetical protein